MCYAPKLLHNFQYAPICFSPSAFSGSFEVISPYLVCIFFCRVLAACPSGLRIQIVTYLLAPHSILISVIGKLYLGRRMPAGCGPGDICLHRQGRRIPRLATNRESSFHGFQQQSKRSEQNYYCCSLPRAPAARKKNSSGSFQQNHVTPPCC